MDDCALVDEGNLVSGGEISGLMLTLHDSGMTAAITENNNCAVILLFVRFKIKQYT